MASMTSSRLSPSATIGMAPSCRAPGLLGRARRRRDLVAALDEQRQQSPSDRAGCPGDEDLHRVSFALTRADARRAAGASHRRDRRVAHDPAIAPARPTAACLEGPGDGESVSSREVGHGSVRSDTRRLRPFGLTPAWSRGSAAAASPSCSRSRPCTSPRSTRPAPRGSTWPWSAAPRRRRSCRTRSTPARAERSTCVATTPRRRRAPRCWTPTSHGVAIPGRRILVAGALRRAPDGDGAEALQAVTRTAAVERRAAAALRRPPGPVIAVHGRRDADPEPRVRRAALGVRPGAAVAGPLERGRAVRDAGRAGRRARRRRGPRRAGRRVRRRGGGQRPARRWRRAPPPTGSRTSSGRRASSRRSRSCCCWA